jgi:hypothetical protein
MKTHLKVNFGINNERQDCKIGTLCVGVLVGWGRVNVVDDKEGIWLMGFIYLYKMEQ